MKKNILYLTTLAIIMLFGACSNEPLFNDKEYSPGKARTILLTATMPDDNPTTRVALEQNEDLTVALTWEEGDQLQLVFVQGDIKKKETVTVGNISPDGKNANFEIVIPEEITDKFDLYGVYGGGGLSDDNPTIAMLPTKAGETGTLESIEENEHVMFYFASKDMGLTYSEPNVVFKNFGSLFSITLKNTATASLDDIAEARLVEVGGDGKWAYNIGDGGGSYDLITGMFQETESAGNHISFKAAKSSVASEESITFWGWYPPLPEKVWPELALHLLKEDGVEIAVSANTKPARTEATAAGMSYYFDALWDGTKLEFGTSREPHIFVKATGVDTNDGATWATATTLSKALEMMLEGDEIHIAAGTYVPTNMITSGDKEGDVTFEINKNVTLIGGYPADASQGAVASKVNETILSGNKKSYHTVTVTAPVETGEKVIIKNLAIKDGFAGAADAGMVAVNGVNYNRGFAGGLSIGTSVVDVIDCVISDNESGQHVGGVYVHNGAIARFIDTDIINNKAATNCGGILNGATTYLIDSNISDNVAGGVCGGVYNFDKEGGGSNPTHLYIYNSTVARNKLSGTWSGGGGLYAREGSHTQIVNSTFNKNEAGIGGAIRVYTADNKITTADIISSTLYDNSAIGNGGGIETQPGVTVKMYNTIITGNTAGGGKDIFLSENTTTSSYMILGDKVTDKDGAVISGQTFDHTTMINDLAVNGTCMITGSSPAATLGMNAALLQTLASTFTPAIDSEIISNDQLGVSRIDKAAMGAVVSDGSEPSAPDVPKADMLDVVFNLDGTAKDISPMNHVMKLMLDENAPITVTKDDANNLNIANFNPVANGQHPGDGNGSCYYFDYQENIEFQNKLANGHTFETMVKFDVDYRSGDLAYETKFFSTHQAGGTGFLIANNSRGNGLTFLPNVSVADGGGSNWIWTNSQERPDGQSWYHLVGIWDKEAGKSYIYVNGEKKAEVDAAGFYKAANLNPLWTTIGADPGVYPTIQNPFKGSVAIARIYDKALTEAEAKLLWDEVK